MQFIGLPKYCFVEIKIANNINKLGVKIELILSLNKYFLFPFNNVNKNFSKNPALIIILIKLCLNVDYALMYIFDQIITKNIINLSFNK